MSFADVDRAMLGVDPALELVVTYNRVIEASIARIWDKVFDWQNLPVPHDTCFNHVELVESGVAGWRVRLTGQPEPLDLELRIDKVNARYRVQTLAGDGIGAEIWTLLKPLAPDSTEIEVRCYLPGKCAQLGEHYRRSCQRLWDEHEAVMQQHERLANAKRNPQRGTTLPIALGKLDALLPRLPLLVDVEAETFRVVAVEGKLYAHATVCPHWQEPLSDVAVEDGCIRCPWHGFLFDVRSGESADGRDYV